MSKKLLYTIGYEGAELSDFIATLAMHGIEKVIDVRELPISRKRGFSKARLADALAQKDIEYIHIKALGDPKPGREAARRGDLTTFAAIYLNHLGSIEAQAALKRAVTEVRDKKSALLCYERSPVHCHRAIVASEISKQTKITISHIGVTALQLRHRVKTNEPANTSALG